MKPIRWWVVGLVLVVAGPALLPAQPIRERAPRGPVTIVPAGPTWAAAGSIIPGQIGVQWREVSNATGYRVTRSSTAPEPEVKIAEYANTSQLAEGGMWAHTDAPVDLRWTYSYKVYALFGTTVSTPSPVASARSVAVAQPTNLKYGVTITPNTMGRVNVALSWSAAPNATKYVITGTDFIGMSSISVTGTTYTLNNVPAGKTYRVCVGAIYPYSIGDPGTAPCIDIKLQ